MPRATMKAAEAAFRRRSMVAPGRLQAHGSLANFLWAVGKRDEAERELKAALGIEPTSPAANRAMAALYISHNRGAEAEPYLKTYAEATGTLEAGFCSRTTTFVRARCPRRLVFWPVWREEGKFRAGDAPPRRARFHRRSSSGGLQRAREILQREPGTNPRSRPRPVFCCSSRRTRMR